MAEPAAPSALYFEPDGYDLGQRVLVGRQVASHGFLRAAAAAGDGPLTGPLTGYGPPPCAQAFADAVAAVSPGRSSDFIPLDQLERLTGRVCHRPDPQLGPEARLRLRVGAGAYSLSGVVHTSATVLDQLASLLAEPLMPWDALICPSRSLAASLETLHAAQADYLRWRFGAAAQVPALNLPIIPLGVHCDDFAFSAADRAGARQALGLAEDEVAALYVGRLSLATKAHPLAMYLGLQAAAERTGRRLVLIQCGWTNQPAMAKALEEGARDFAPSVRSLVVDGRDRAAARRCWAGADLFLSLSDNPQETFGLTPIEAMAAGLPAVVSDWDGYRESVRDGEDGFRIRTWAPGAGVGDGLARVREAGTLPMDLACWAAAAATAVEITTLAERLTELVARPELRARQGAAGRERARSVYDWPVVYAQHQALWAELDARRRAATDVETAWLAAAPRRSAAGADFFEIFGHYPSVTLGPETRIALASGASWDRYQAIARHALFPMDPAPERLAAPLWPALADGPMTLAEAAQATGAPLRALTLCVGALAKMGLLELSEAWASSRPGAA